MESSKERIRNTRYRVIALVIAIAIHFAMYMLVQQVMTSGEQAEIAETMAAEVSK